MSDSVPASIFDRALQHHRAARLFEAASLYRLLAALSPQEAAAHHNLAAIAQGQGWFDIALTLARHAITLNPTQEEFWISLAAGQRELGNEAAALDSLRVALILRPDRAEALNNLGVTLRRQSRLDEGITWFRRAVAMHPSHAEIHCNLAAALLRRGDDEEGWREHEWRLEPGAPVPVARDLPQKIWRGEDLRGRSLLLHSEQGFGDDLQFARYAAPLAALGAEVILEVPASLTRLMASLTGVARVVARGDAPADCDFRLPSMSAPARLGAPPRIAAECPYLWADTAEIARWRARLQPLPRPWVGLVWAGDPRPHQKQAQAIDRRRSIALAEFLPLLRLEWPSFVSLQKGAAASQLLALDPALAPSDWMGEIGDFAATAALVSALDLVIAVDTAVAHLAGALGRPLWILSRHDGCWRWRERQERTEWYPTARIFHQLEAEAWRDVILRVAAALQSDQTLARSPAT